MNSLKRVGFALLAPVIAVLIAVLATSVVIAASGSDSSAGDFWSVILSKPDNRLLVNILNQTTMIYLAAVAAAIGFRMGLFNIGVEGQYLLASYTAATFAGAALLPGALNIMATLVIAMAVGAIWAGIAGILRTTRGVSEVISTIMLNSIALILVGYLLDRYGLHGGNQVRTKDLPESSQLAGWLPFERPDGPIWTLGLLAVAVGVGFWVLLNKTRFGFDLRATGLSQTAAVASGIKVDRMVLISMLLSGAVAGLIWMPAYFGSAHTYGTTFQAGLGFTGIAVALLGRNQPVGMVFGAVLFAFLSTQSNTLTFQTDISPSIVQITQGVAVLAVVIAYELVRRYRIRLEQRTVARARTAPVQEVTA
ncbi:sugar ABC transporter permease [Nocardioides sp. Root1257]|uniref:ABC transporter permease n=1 Tax=unclassified Nocardioides TaxID=2615069 RepID=UPI0006F21326|nr:MULTISPECIES: ABC transporter permease [unclassified Nocardioides]KQW45231.1 sugar ABC transporter permease [Nocardioides sp. Root1257]KRC52494.1 sugar ABC transporter permease [Nocardioides sp. Root224]